jgi:alkanesulfonate monooxygenase SsuD/methylene tetrahydromethanopterin reductase-like flavin-dependent oxidoreductase (luciferase family)
MLEAADSGGFYCYHIAEHQATPLSMSPSPNLVLSAVAQRTKTIKLGSLCYILPLYDPIRLVMEICMLDQMSGGRLQIGVSRGVSPIELGFFGLDPNVTRDIFMEDMEIIQMGLTSKSVSFSGRHRTYRDVPIEMTTVQKPTPPFWYPTSSLETVPWVAENSFNTCFNGDLGHVRSQVNLFKENLKTDDDRANLKYGISRYVFIAETDGEAMALAELQYKKHLTNLNHLRNSRRVASDGVVPDTAGANVKTPMGIQEAVEGGWAAVGSPSTVIEQIATIQAATGVNYFIFNPLLADTSTEQGIASVQMFSQEVIPALASA